MNPPETADEPVGAEILASPDYDNDQPWPHPRVAVALLAGLLGVSAAGSVLFVIYGLAWLQAVVIAAMALALFLMGLIVGRRQ